MTPQVYIAGQAVAALAPIGDVVIAHEWPDSGIGGPVSASFTVLLAPANRPSWLAKGSLASVRFGGWHLLSGQVSEVSVEEGSIKVTIDGAAREGTSTVCLTSGGVPSSTPDTVIDAAISRGAITWTRPASISASALTTGDETEKLNTVTDLLTAYADESGSRLYVDQYRRLLKASDPTFSTVFAIPGAGELAWATEAQATRLIGRWKNAAGTLSTTIVGSGALERRIDMTPRGQLDSTRANAILNSILTRSTAGGWVNGLTLTSGQFLSAPHLAGIAEAAGRGLMVRNLGQRDPRQDRVQVGFVDFIVERSEWNVSEGTITLTPRGMVSRDFAAILKSFGVQEAQ